MEINTSSKGVNYVSTQNCMKETQLNKDFGMD